MAVALTMQDKLKLPCGQVLMNRIAKAAMTEGLADEYSMPTENLESLYKMWGSGNAGGLLITGNFQVDRRYMERPGNVCIERSMDESELISKLNKCFVQSATENDKNVKVWAQLSHAGRQANPLVNIYPVGPSPIAAVVVGKKLEVPRVLDKEEMDDIIDRFAYAALVCKKAGIHGVEIHAAHGYLLSSFLSPAANIRDDSYGGSVENRARLLIEVIRAIRNTVGPDYPIGVKLNCADFIKGGLEHSDSIKIAKMLENEGIDLLEISGGNVESLAMLVGGDYFDDSQNPFASLTSSTDVREAYFLKFAHDISKTLEKTPILVTGGFRSRSIMESAIRSGGAHMIGVGRPVCASPDCVKQLLEGKIHKLPSPENEFPVPWYAKWASNMNMIKYIKFMLSQLWCLGMIIGMGNGKQPTLNVGIFSLINEINKLDHHKAQSLKNLGPITGEVYNPPSRKLAFYKITITIGILSLLGLEARRVLSS